MDSPRINRIRFSLAWSLALAGLAFLGLFAGRPAPSSPAQGGGFAPDEDLLIFQERLESGWQDYSWAERRLPDPEVRLLNRPSIRFVPAEFRGLYLHTSAFSTAGYLGLTFSVLGAAPGGQKITVCAVDANNQFGTKVNLADFLPQKAIPSDKPALGVIPLEALKADNKRISGFCFQDGTGKAQPPVYLANIRLVAKNPAPDGPIAVTVDASKPLGPISPYIYGLASPGKEMIAQLRLKLWRWGGNPNSRYNWEKGNCWNAARDWEFRNGNYGNTAPDDRQPSGVADKAIASGKAAGADALITIPTLGWVARDDNNATASVGVPSDSGEPVAPGSEAIPGYDPAENRKRVSIRSLPRKGRPFADPPDLNDDVVYQDEWVYHLTQKFGRAAQGGVKFYAMDNEPDLWAQTHTDMHPVRPDYQEIRDQFLAYASAIKDVDPTAQVTGPVSWGWTNYFFSPRDQGKDKYATHADRKAHGDLPFLAWFLREVAAHDRRVGRRTLDVLDVHFYPQAAGVYDGKTDPKTNALRLRSVRALWDPTYSDESWIGTPVQLIPRLREWVDKNYPGTKIGLTEWNWGAETTLNGALAIAEALGVLGRERVDLACYWMHPPLDSPGFFAFKMFRNADGQGNGFGDVALPAQSALPGRVSCFASLDRRNGLPTLILLNKHPKEPAKVALRLTGVPAALTAKTYLYSGANLKAIVPQADARLVGGRAEVSLPAYSILLLRCQR
jgi:hypothetical protein